MAPATTSSPSTRNQAELQLNGDDDNDIFIVRAFAIAAVCDTNADSDAGCEPTDVNFVPADAATFPTDHRTVGVGNA